MVGCSGYVGTKVRYGSLNMIEINIKDEHVHKAKIKSKEMGVINNSIRQGKGNLCGFVGEAVMEDYFKASEANTYDYDIILSNGKKVDVKTKQTKVKPRDYYDCSIANFNTRQNCDYYAFVRVNNELTKAWFLGLVDKKDYLEKSRFLKKGDVDGDNRFVVRADCHNLSIEQVWKMSKHAE